MHGHHPFSERVEGLSFLSNLSLTIVGRVSRECKSRRAFRVVDWRVSNAVTPAKSGRKESVNTRAQNAEDRSEEHTSELQSLMRISYAVFCLKKKNEHQHVSYP